ncbi:MAG: type secretion protein family [Myxococcaceae bacterium]|nr:type secretion protein family [Myxococcaceae bacterium]
MGIDTGSSLDGVAVDAPPGLRATSTRSEDFYATLRALEAAHPEAPRIGEAIHASDEPIRLGQRPTLAFEAAAVVHVEPARESRPPRVEVSFFGVFGANGPLPLHLTEYAYQRIHHAHDHTLARFADIFHHRLLALLYRTWAVSQPTVSHDRPNQDAFARRVSALVGQPKSVRDETAIDLFARYAVGQFVTSARHPEGLKKVISAFFRCKVEVEEFVGEWLVIPDEYCWRVIGSQAAGAATALGRLGHSTRIGRSMWSRDGKFRLSIGPLKRAAYEKMMPGGSDLKQLIELVGRYVGPELSWDVRLILQEQDMRPTILGGSARLGRDAYLVRSGAIDKQWADFVFEPLNHSS